MVTTVRYRRYREGPDPLAPPYDARAALADLGESVLSGANVSSALAELLHHGAPGLTGLEELAARVRRHGERLRRRGGLDGTLRHARALLDRAIGHERAELLADPGEEARLREAELDSLPEDTAAAVRRLTDYPWLSATARDLFQRLHELIRHEILDSRFRGTKRALAQGTVEITRVRAMVTALCALLEAADHGRHTQDDFERFMADYGDLFPERPRDLNGLIDTLARRAAAAQRLMASLAPEQRAELTGLTEAAMAESGMATELHRLSEMLHAHRPDLPWSETERVAGPARLGVGDATTVLERLADLAELEAALGQRYPGAALDDIDETVLGRLLGDSAVDDLARLRRLSRDLEEEGYLRGPRHRRELTPKAVRRLARAALRDALARLPRGRPGRHPTLRTGGDGEPTGATLPWEFGDERPIAAAQTGRNAAIRRFAAGPRSVPLLRITDFEVVDTDSRDAAAVCLLVDLSYSMRQRGLWEQVKRTALALHSLITTDFPQDAVRVIGFSDHARELPPAGLAELAGERVQGTNLQHALLLARRHLDRHADLTPIVLVVTDGEPTAHLAHDGTVSFSWPPSSETVELTLAEVDRMTRRSARITMFPLATDSRLDAFVEEVARRNGGRLVRPDGHLGSAVVADFLGRRGATPSTG